MEHSLAAFARKHGIPLLEGEPLCRHTTFRIGGPARFFALPPDGEALIALLDYAHGQGLRYAVIGKGSNLLAADEGFDGLVIRTPEGALRWTDERTVWAPSGFSLAQLSAAAAGRALDGLAFAQGIPGTVGGAVVMNAGAYGGEIAQVLRSVRCWTPEGVRTLPAEELELSYRHSVFSHRPDWVVIDGLFCLTPGDAADIAARMADYAARRREKQPLEYPSAGSAFRRPAGSFAGKLIEEAGLKGLSVGGAQVSEKHAGFIVNRGGATCADVRALMEEVARRVEERFGVTLTPEVKYLK